MNLHFLQFRNIERAQVVKISLGRRQVPDCPAWLTHWGRVTHICVSKLTTIGSDNGLSPSRRQAIIWTNTGILLIQTLGTNFSEILREIYTFSFKKMHLKMSSGKCRPSCLGLNVLKPWMLMAWRQKESGYQQPWYWLSSSRIFWFRHQIGLYM